MRRGETVPLKGDLRLFGMWIGPDAADGSDCPTRPATGYGLILVPAQPNSRAEGAGDGARKAHV